MLAVYALAAWTVFVWGTRISNIVGGAGSPVDLALAVGLAGLGVAVGVAAWRRTPRWLLTTLVLATLGMWAVRTPLILFDADRGAAFKTVHLVLAAVSVALAVAAWRTGSTAMVGAYHRRRSPAGTAPPR
ncbi:MAG: hypothetical protein ACR2G7_10455 [Acidimicrobiales bacterium]